MERHVVAAREDLAPGERRIVVVRGRSIGVFNVAGRLYALRNVCPHHGAPLCLGPVGGTMLPSAPGEYEYGLDGRVLRCPWHGYEFDLADGRSLTRPDRLRVKTYRVETEGDEIVVYA